MIKRGELIEVEVEGVDEKGRGYGYVDSLRVSSYFVIPGDVAKVRVSRVWGREAFGELVELKSESSFRVKPKCRFFGECGGCKLQNMEYSKQLLYKRRMVKSAFQKHGLEVEVGKVTPSERKWFYRNRMDYVVGKNLEIGLRAPEKWFKVVDIDECHLLSERGNKALNIFREFINSRGLKAFDTKRVEGFLRYLVLREGKFTGSFLVNIVTYLGEFSQLTDLIDEFKGIKATSVYWSINPRITDLSVGEELKLIYGEKYLVEEILNYKFYIHPNSFFQTNSYQAVNLVKAVERLVDCKPRDRIVDLYCGTGLFSIALSSLVDEIVGIELDEHAVESALENIKVNGARNVVFIRDYAENLLSHVSEAEVIVVDPPRTGMQIKVIKSILKLNPREIVYVSCNPNSMARDVSQLSKKYLIDGKILLLDMFPHTPHVEAVAKLVKR